MAFVFTILASVFIITSSGFVYVIQAQGVSLLVSPPREGGNSGLDLLHLCFKRSVFTKFGKGRVSSQSLFQYLCQ